MPNKSTTKKGGAWLGSKYVVRGEELTIRELQVLSCAALGLGQIETAARLGLNIETIKTHRRTLLYKLDARNVTNAVYLVFVLEGMPLEEIPKRNRDYRKSSDDPKVKSGIG